MNNYIIMKFLIGQTGLKSITDLFPLKCLDSITCLQTTHVIESFHNPTLKLHKITDTLLNDL